MTDSSDQSLVSERLHVDFNCEVNIVEFYLAPPAPTPEQQAAEVERWMKNPDAPMPEPEPDFAYWSRSGDITDYLQTGNSLGGGLESAWGLSNSDIVEWPEEWTEDRYSSEPNVEIRTFAQEPAGLLASIDGDEEVQDAIRFVVDFTRDWNLTISNVSGDVIETDIKPPAQGPCWVVSRAHHRLTEFEGFNIDVFPLSERELGAYKAGLLKTNEILKAEGAFAQSFMHPGGYEPEPDLGASEFEALAAAEAVHAYAVSVFDEVKRLSPLLDGQLVTSSLLRDCRQFGRQLREDQTDSFRLAPAAQACMEIVGVPFALEFVADQLGAALEARPARALAQGLGSTIELRSEDLIWPAFEHVVRSRFAASARRTLPYIEAGHPGVGEAKAAEQLANDVVWAQLEQLQQQAAAKGQKEQLRASASDLQVALIERVRAAGPAVEAALDAFQDVVVTYLLGPERQAEIARAEQGLVNLGRTLFPDLANANATKMEVFWRLAQVESWAAPDAVDQYMMPPPEFRESLPSALGR